MKKDLFLKKKYRSLIGRLAVAAVALSLCGILILWDTGVLDLPFLQRKDRRKPEALNETREEPQTEEFISLDWDTFSKDAIASVYDYSLVENAASLLTTLPFDPNTMTLTKQKLSDGSYSTSMGFVTKEEGKSSLLFLAPSMQEVPDGEKYVLTHHRDADGNAVFQMNDADGYFRLDLSTMTFVPSAFDPANDDTKIDLSLPAHYGKGEEGKTLFSENGLFGYTGEYLDGRRTKTFTVEAQYPTAFSYSEGFAVMADANGKVTIRNDRGEEVFTHLSLILPEKEGEEALGFHYFDGGILRVIIAAYDAEGNLTSRRESIINTKGQEVTLPDGYSAVSLSEGILVVTDGKKYGYLSATGAWIADPVYTAAAPFMEGLAAVTGEEGKMGLIDSTGKTVLPCAFDLITNFSDGNALCFSQSTGWHLLSKLNGSFAPDGGDTPKTSSSYQTKVTITRGPQNTFDYDPDEIIEFPTILSTPSRTTHPES